MYVVTVSILVKPEHVPAFIAATLENARNTRKEPGNVRFDVLQAVDEPGRFTLYEAYHTPDGFTQHQQTPHYFTWKATVTDMLVQPRTAVKSNALFFDNAAL